jgi:hypothetical protein
VFVERRVDLTEQEVRRECEADLVGLNQPKKTEGIGEDDRRFNLELRCPDRQRQQMSLNCSDVVKRYPVHHIFAGSKF